MSIHKTLLWRCFSFGFPALGSILQKIDHVAATNETSLPCNPHKNRRNICQHVVLSEVVHERSKRCHGAVQPRESVPHTSGLGHGAFPTQFGWSRSFCPTGTYVDAPVKSCPGRADVSMLSFLSTGRTRWAVLEFPLSKTLQQTKKTAKSSRLIPFTLRLSKLY